MLDLFSRSAIVGMSLVCVIGAVALAPARARSSDSPRPASAAPFGVSDAPVPAADIPIVRDPFTGEPSSRSTVATAALPPASAPALPRGDVGPLPSNLANPAIPTVPADATPASTATATRVTAIVTGAHPYAMVETAGNHEIKGIGDRIAGTPIAAIAIDGITLVGGQRLDVASGALR